MSRPKSRASAAIRSAQRWLRRLMYVVWRIACAILIGGSTMGPPPPPPPPPPDLVACAEAVSTIEGSDQAE